MKVRAHSRRRATGASALLAASALVLHGMAASASSANTSFTWSGGGTDALWSDAGNWVNGSIPVDNGNGWVLFPELTSGLISNQNLDTPFFLANMTFTGSGYALSGAALRLGGSLTDSGGAAGMNTLANNIVLTGALPITAADLELSGTIASANGVMNSALNIGASNTLLTLTGTGSNFNNLQVSGGSVVLDGGSLTLTSTSNVSSTDAVAVGLGTTASAALTVKDGATLDTSAASDVGIEATASGMAQMTVTGAKTLWKLPSTTNIGEEGSGSLTVTNGAMATSSGSSFFVVGDGGAGSLVISGGGSVSDFLGEINTGSTAQVSDAGSIWTNSILLINGTGQLSVQSGGAVSIGSLDILSTSGVSLNVMGGAVSVGSLIGSGAVGSISLSDPVAGIALTINGASGSNTFSGAISGTGSLLKTGASTQVFAGVNTYGGSTTITGGALVIAAGSDLPNGTNVSISNGGALDLANHGTGPKIVVQLSGLTIAESAGAWKGVLDLSNNDLIVHSGASGEAVAATIVSQVASGRGTNGAWTGTGITSSAAAASPSDMALAVVLNDTNQTGSLSGTPLVVSGSMFNGGLSTFDGATVNDGDVLVKYTYYGDALLNGSVSAADYIQIDNGFGSQLTGWYNGDFNYDGVINGDDYTLIDNAFNSQGITSVTSPVSTPTEMIAAVPEPGSLGPLAAAAVGFIARRRKVVIKSSDLNRGPASV